MTAIGWPRWVVGLARRWKHWRHNDHRETCWYCLRGSPLGFSVPTGLYVKVTGNPNSVWCAECFMRRADSLLLDWATSIEFWPCALVNEEANDGHND